MRKLVMGFAERNDVFVVASEGEMCAVMNDIVRVFAVRISAGVVVSGKEGSFFLCFDVAGFEMRNGESWCLQFSFFE